MLNSTSSVNRLDDAAHPVAHLDESPSIQPDRVLDHSAPIALFGDDRWPLDALENDSTRKHRTIIFSNFPEGFRRFAKSYVYALINFGNPQSLIDSTFGPYRRWLNPASIYRIHSDLRVIVTWLACAWTEQHSDTPVRGPRDLDSGHLDDLKAWISSQPMTKKVQADRLEAARRAWHLGPYLPEAERWPEPRWLLERAAVRRSTENRTKRISQATMAPLITWATAFVETFADDILAAHRHYQEARAAELPEVGTTLQRCTEVLESYDRRLPGMNRAGEPGTDLPAWHVLAYRHGVSARRMASAFMRHPERDSFTFDTDPELSTIDFRPTATFDGRPWLNAISVLDVHPQTGARGGRDQNGALLTHLLTACVIVIAYLTGARPEEVLGLEHGAAPDPVTRVDGGQLYSIRGRVWKGVSRDAEGRPIPPRTAHWATVKTAWRAVRIAEEIQLLHERTSGPLLSTTGATHASPVISDWIVSFIGFVNRRLVPMTPRPETFHIPEDPDGLVTLRRFRRTLAWFLSNRPGGEITVAIQYQHLRTIMSGGYAGTKESGMSSLLLEEDWAHRRETIRQLGHLLATGEAVSGPAADRAISAVRRLPSNVTPAEERRLRKDPDLVLYDNPAAVALCAYRPATALCNRDRTGNSHPNMTNCAAACPNLVRTDTHLDLIGRTADSLRSGAAISPKPIAQSMLERAATLDGLVSEFSRSRTTSEGTTDA